MERSKLNVKINKIEKVDEEVVIEFSIENPSDDIDTVEISRCTFLDFKEVQSQSKEKNHLEDLVINGHETSILNLSFALTEAFDETFSGAITLDLYDKAVEHHISYSFDIENENSYDLKDVYESSHNDPLFNGGDGAEAIMNLVSTLKETLGAGNVIVKEVNRNDLEDLLPKQKSKKLLN